MDCDNVTKNHYTIVDGVPVPKGFSHVAGTTKENGFVIKNDTDGNEFVWVPVDSTTPYKYERVAFSRQILDEKTGEIIREEAPEYIFIENMPSDEQTSVNTYGGFYIGRYETGIEDYTSLDTNANNTQYEYTGYKGGKVSIKAGQQVWNYITRDKAKKVSEELYKKIKGDSVNSKLCSSYAWDTALKFIETKHPTYSKNSTQGNYTDKSANLGKPANTGLTEAVNNIYDMGGNVNEWTTEECNYSNDNYTARGGNYTHTSSSGPAATRHYLGAKVIGDSLSFRVTLYL